MQPEVGPVMLYFGPWNEPGHYFFRESGMRARLHEEKMCPWNPWSSDDGIDGQLQPGCYQVLVGGHYHWKREGPEIEGNALLHHRNGWTAISFWDHSVDKRPGCNSTYLAMGEFTFDEMVEMAKSRFSYRWNKMQFEVKLSEGVDKA